jgi:hypothetical protein
MMATTELSDFAASVASALLSARPEWEPHVVSSGDQELRIEMPLPGRLERSGLFVHTDSELEYIIVGIGPAQAEIADWSCNASIESIVGEALQLVDAIMEERYVGARLFIGSALLTQAQIERPDIMELVSWRGTFDRQQAEPQMPAMLDELQTELHPC